MPKTFYPFLAWLIVLVGSCSKQTAPAPSENETKPLPARSAVASLDACTLLTSEEIASVQGEPVQETKASSRSEPDVVLSQCYFTLPTFNNSISLSVTTYNAKKGGRSPREFWDKNFSEAKLQPRERADGRIKLPPDRVEGLGDDAFWTGGPAGGLYILKGDRVVFVGIGSTGDEASRPDKVRRLGELVLKRL